MERTIKYLNSKWYYRFAKIAFVVLFIIIFSRFNYIFINTLGFKSVDGNKTKILCNANSKEFSANDVTGLALSRNDFKNYSFDYKYFFEGDFNKYLTGDKIKDILEKCYDTDLTDYDIPTIQRNYEITGFKNNPKEYTDAYLNTELKKIEDAGSDDGYKYLDYSIKLFDIKPVFTYSTLITYFLIGNLIILLVFEGLRRLFYYIVLGKFIPKKEGAINKDDSVNT